MDLISHLNSMDSPPPQVAANYNTANMFCRASHMPREMNPVGCRLTDEDGSCRWLGGRAPVRGPRDARRGKMGGYLRL